MEHIDKSVKTYTFPWNFVLILMINLHYNPSSSCKDNTDFALNCALLLGAVDESISSSRKHIAKKLRNAIIDRERLHINQITSRKFN